MKKALILAGIYWDDTLQRHQQFAKYLKRAGYEVYFVEHIVSSSFKFDKLVSFLGKRRKKGTANERLEDVHVINAGFVNPGWWGFDLYNTRKIDRVLKIIGREFDLVINYLPISTTRIFLDKLQYTELIYDCVRNFTGWDGYGKDIAQEEEFLIKRCNKIFTDSFFLTNMCERMSKKRVVQFMPIANKEWRRGCVYKRKIEKIEKVVYFGTIDKHIDISVLKALSENGIEIHLWGNIVTDINFEYINHGYVNDLEQLAKEIISIADAIILPYQGKMDGVIPAKMMQCLYTELPVFISHFYDSDILKEYVYLYDSIDHLYQEVKDFDAIKHSKKIKKIGDFMIGLNEEQQYEKFFREI